MQLATDGLRAREATASAAPDAIHPRSPPPRREDELEDPDGSPASTSTSTRR